jgi:hypothetical protein
MIKLKTVPKTKLIIISRSCNVVKFAAVVVDDHKGLDVHVQGAIADLDPVIDLLHKILN